MRKVIQSVKRGLRWVWGHKGRTVVLLLVLYPGGPKTCTKSIPRSLLRDYGALV